jgi:hypothetical protein
MQYKVIASVLFFVTQIMATPSPTPIRRGTRTVVLYYLYVTFHSSALTVKTNHTFPLILAIKALRLRL